MSEQSPTTGAEPRLAPRPYLTESAVGTAPPAAQADGAVTVTIDGRQIQAKAGQLIIEAADEAGIYIPRFCYHRRMKPVGMCRMCLVEVSGPRGATLMPACYNPVAEGMEIRTDSPMAKKAQEGVLEFLLVNHPLDCPVCDKGGECPLQDQTLAYGPGESRFVEEKRHWDKPIAISPLVYLDRERCIQCGRCVRFAAEVAGDPLIDFAERGDMTEVATFPEEPYSSYFSGNVVQICPVGALTAKPYRFKARPWDLEQVESTCTTCAVGCRVALQSSQGELIRMIGVDSDPVNWGWLCDKGRWGYEGWKGAGRVTVPLVREGDQLVESSWGEALAAAANGLRSAMEKRGGAGVAVVGGARLANEDAYAWAKAARLALGTDNVDAQLGDGLPAEVLLGLPRATIDQAAAAPLVITLGPDIKDELPVLYLRLRGAVHEQGTQLVEITPAPTGLTRYASETLLYRPGEAASVARALVAAGSGGGDGIDRARAHIARAGQKAAPGAPSIVVILGRPSLAEGEGGVVAAARELAGLPGVAFLSALRRGNVHGALDLGLAPGVLPGRVSLEEGRAWFERHWGAGLPAERGLTTAGILEAASRGDIGALVLLGADPLADFPDADLALRGVLGAGFVVAVDTHLTESSRRADVLLPAAAWSERRGTFTNIEGRVTWLGQMVTAAGMSWPDWMIASELSARLGVDLGFARIEEVWEEIARVSPLHRGLPYDLLAGVSHRDGIVAPVGAEPVRPARALDPMADPGIQSAELHKVVSTSLLFSATSTVPEPDGQAPGNALAPAGGPPGGEQEEAPAPPAFLRVPAWDGVVAPPVDTPGLRLVSRRTLWDGGTLVQNSPSLAGLAPEPALRVHPSALAALGAADGEAVRVVSERGSLSVAAVGDPEIPRGTAVLAWNLAGARAAGLVDAAAAATAVRVELADGSGGQGGGDGG